MSRPEEMALGEASRLATLVSQLLPASIAPLFNASFIYSTGLFDDFVHRLAVQVFRATGLEAAACDPGSAEEIATRAGLERERAVPALDWILRLLAARGLLHEVEGGGNTRRYHALGPLPALDPAPLREAQREHDPSWLPSYVLAETVARDYPKFLRGEAAGEDILFSPTRLRLWIDFFSNDNGLYAVNNRIGAIGVEAWMPRANGTVLELGGGLASAAIAVLERLAHGGRLAALREYRFTEIVPTFLRRGQQSLLTRFPASPWLRFGAVDMDRPFEAQGVAPGSLSLVYAVNTVHVARDLHATLAQVLGSLEPGGRLVLSECVRPHPGEAIYAEFIFNLMETFRAPVLHPAYRPNGGFLTPEQWRAALEGAGFAGVQFLPDIAAIRERVPGFFVAAIGATRPR